MIMKKNNIISEWLDQHGDPEIDKLVQENLEKTIMKKDMNRDTSWDDPQLSDGDFPSNQPKFKVGDKAVKVKGYKFPCTIVSVFQTVEGNTRVVGEMDEYGLLHIFNEDQLEKAN